MENFKLLSNDNKTEQIRQSGITSWLQLVHFVKNMTYGRTSDRKNLNLVWEEQRGTCSSKHAFLKAIADLNNISNVKLMLCMFKMNTINTPKIGNALEDKPIDYMPEAHCYLKVNGESIDVTSLQSSFAKIKNDAIEEIEIVPEQVFQYKIDYHKEYLKKWIIEEKLNLSFDNIWTIREKCIENISR